MEYGSHSSKSLFLHLFLCLYLFSLSPVLSKSNQQNKAHSDSILDTSTIYVYIYIKFNLQYFLWYHHEPRGLLFSRSFQSSICPLVHPPQIHDNNWWALLPINYCSASLPPHRLKAHNFIHYSLLTCECHLLFSYLLLFILISITNVLHWDETIFSFSCSLFTWHEASFFNNLWDIYVQAVCVSVCIALKCT